jgi:hypothetical protein
LTVWPTHEDGLPKRWYELNESQRRSVLAMGLRAVLREFELASEAHRGNLERW